MSDPKPRNLLLAELDGYRERAGELEARVAELEAENKRLRANVLPTGWAWIALIRLGELEAAESERAALIEAGKAMADEADSVDGGESRCVLCQLVGGHTSDCPVAAWRALVEGANRDE